MSIIAGSIGWILVDANDIDSKLPRAVSASYNSYQGYTTHVTRNALNQICERSGDRKPKVWKRRETADRKAREHNESTERYGSSGRIREVMPVQIFGTTKDLREAVAWEIRQQPGLLADIIDMIDAQHERKVDAL